MRRFEIEDRDCRGSTGLSIMNPVAVVSTDSLMEVKKENQELRAITTTLTDRYR